MVLRDDLSSSDSSGARFLEWRVRFKNSASTPTLKGPLTNMISPESEILSGVMTPDSNLGVFAWAPATKPLATVAAPQRSRPKRGHRWVIPSIRTASAGAAPGMADALWLRD